MKLYLSLLVLSVAFTSNAQSNYNVNPAANTKFDAKYSITITMDESKGKLSATSNAPIKTVLMDVYGKTNFAQRKRIRHNLLFHEPQNNFSYDLHLPKLKDKYCYWLKIYTQGGEFKEMLIMRKSGAPAVEETAEDLAANGEEQIAYDVPELTDRNPGNANDIGKPTSVQTNIICAAAAKKVKPLLLQTDGVHKVEINTATGIMKIWYSSDGSSLEDILDVIKKAGFAGGGGPATRKIASSCTGIVASKK